VAGAEEAVTREAAVDAAEAAALSPLPWEAAESAIDFAKRK
jgi:hypothetical protein